MDRLFCLHHADERGSGAAQRGVPACFDKRRWRIVESGQPEPLSISQIEVSEISLADARRVLQHRLEYRLQLAG